MSGGPNASVPVPQPDGSGGAGSFPQQLLSIITGRAAAFLDGEIQRRYGGGLSEPVTVDASGRVRPESQPGTTAAETTLQELVRSPVTWIVASAAAAIVIILVARR